MGRASQRKHRPRRLTDTEKALRFLASQIKTAEEFERILDRAIPVLKPVVREYALCFLFPSVRAEVEAADRARLIQ